MADKAITGLADYSSLQSVLANSKLQKTNNPAFQLLSGLIGNAQNSNKFINQKFTDINGQQTTIQDGLQSVLNTVSDQNATISALATDIANINTALANIALVLADRNSAIYGQSSFLSGTQNLTSGGEDVVHLDSDIFGSGLRFGNDFFAPTAAQYLFTGSVAFSADANGTRRIRITSTDGLDQIVAQVTADGSDITVVPFALFVSMSNGAAIHANALQDSGSLLTAQGAIQFFRVSYV